MQSSNNPSNNPGQKNPNQNPSKNPSTGMPGSDKDKSGKGKWNQNVNK